MKKFLCLAVATLAFAPVAFAATNPWFGTWKLNRDKSTLTGSTVTVAKVADHYHFDFGAIKYDVYKDGQDHPIMPDRTTSLKPTGKNEWLQVNKIGGKEVSRTKLELSSDEKTLTQKTTGTRADGTTYAATYVNERIGAGTGLAGTFKETKEQNNANAIMTYSDGGAGKIKADYPGSKSSELISFDGKPVVQEGPRAMKGQATVYTKVSATEYKYTVTESGKPYVAGDVTVSADGKVLKDVSWLTVKPSEKETDVYEKQ